MYKYENDIVKEDENFDFYYGVVVFYVDRYV